MSWEKKQSEKKAHFRTKGNKKQEERRADHIHTYLQVTYIDKYTHTYIHTYIHTYKT